MTRKTSEVSAGDTGTKQQYNDLRDEARGSSWLLPYEQATPDLTLKVNEANVYFGGNLVEYAGGNSPSFTAPSSNPRIDVLSLDSDGNLERTAGSEAASPSTPDVPAGNIPICSVYNRVGQTEILEEDDSSNGYIYKDLRAFVQRIAQLGGDGSDGHLEVTSGTTNIDLGGEQVVVKNYKSVEVSGTGKITFSNPHANGTIIIFKVRGDVTLTSTENPLIDLRNLGATEGAGGASTAGPGGDGGRGGGSLYIEHGGTLNFTGTINAAGENGENASASNGGDENNGSDGNNGTSFFFSASKGQGGTGTAAGAFGATPGGAIVSSALISVIDFTQMRMIPLWCGAGGGGGGTRSDNAGGGGGGGGGVVVFLGKSVTASSGTITITGGSGGSGQGPSSDISGGSGGGSYGPSSARPAGAKSGSAGSVGYKLIATWSTYSR